MLYSEGAVTANELQPIWGLQADWLLVWSGLEIPVKHLKLKPGVSMSMMEMIKVIVEF